MPFMVMRDAIAHMDLNGNVRYSYIYTPFYVSSRKENPGEASE